MQEHRLRRISIRLSLAIVTCTAGLVFCAPALAASRSAAQLHHAFAQTVIALHGAGNPAAACSSTTSEGQIALIQIIRGEEQYLPSTTCAEAFAARAKGIKIGQTEKMLTCWVNASSVSEVEQAARKAVVHIRGNRGTVLFAAHNFRICADRQIGGVEETDGLPDTTHWIRKHGRWLFDDQPTGTYSPAGRKTVAMLRAALSGSTIREPGNLAPNVAAFCANGSTNFTFYGNPVPGGDGPWYVTGGYPYTASGQFGPLVDAQGNPQGEVFLYTPVHAEWGIKLVGGALVALPAGSSTGILTPGAAGC